MNTTPKDKDVDYEVIDGIKVAKSMPEDQKQALRDDSNPGADEDFDADVHINNIKTRITLAISSDLLKQIRALARQEGLPYQTLINQLLRKVVTGSSSEPSNESNWVQVMLNLTNELQRANEDKRRFEEELKELKKQA